MRKLLLLALPLAALIFITGCEETQASGKSTGVTALTPSVASTPAPAPAPAQTQQAYRRTTTQALSGGASYIHTQDLADGPLASSPKTEG